MTNLKIELTEDMIASYSVDFTDKESYLKWVDEWKAEYKKLSREIHELKRGRKQFKYQYRDKGMNAVKRRTKVGPNPMHKDYNGYRTEYKIDELSYSAKKLLRKRHDARKVSIHMKKQKLEEAA